MPLRRLYDWVLSWAESPHGSWALFLLALVEASFFPIPPDVLLLALALAQPSRSFFFAMLATSGSVLGGLLGYAIGALLWGSLAGLFFAYVPGLTEEKFGTVQLWFQEYEFWTIFVAGFTPIPYKVFTITAGVMGVNLPVFVFASILSRGLRFCIEAVLLWRWGAQMKAVIDRYFNLLTLVGTALIVLVYVAYKLLK